MIAKIKTTASWVYLEADRITITHHTRHFSHQEATEESCQGNQVWPLPPKGEDICTSLEGDYRSVQIDLKDQRFVCHFMGEAYILNDKGDTIQNISA